MQKRRSIFVYATKYGLPILLFYAMITKFRGLKGDTSQNKGYRAASEELKRNLPEDIKKYFIREGKSYLIDYLFQLPSSVLNGLKESSLQHLQEPVRPQPQSLKIIVASTWRSGTSFLNEILASHPGVFAHYEPLHHFGIKSFYNSSISEATEAINFFTGVLNCRYNDDRYFKNQLLYKSLMRENINLWKLCKGKDEDLCYDKNFIEASCPFFPINLIKSVRLGLSFMKPMLEDETHKLHIIFLVRDPRAVISSRRHLTVNFCLTDDCTNPFILCQNMLTDFKTFIELSKNFSGKLHLIRFEDLALSPFKEVTKLLNKMNLDFDKKMKKIITSHSYRSSSDSFSTLKRSSLMATSWISKLDIKSLNNIQNICSSVMEKLGYKKIKNINNLDVIDLIEPLNLQ